MRIWLSRLKQVLIGLLRQHQETEVDGLLLVDLRADRALDHEQVRAVLQEALTHIRAARNGFPELVLDHLKRVVAIDTTLETASPFGQALNSGFRAQDRQDPVRFAAKLVWAATYVRDLRNRPWWQRHWYSDQARVAADRTEARFLAEYSGFQA